VWKITTPIVLLLLVGISASADESRKVKTRMDANPDEKKRVECILQQAPYCDAILRKIANAAHVKEPIDARYVHLGPAQKRMESIVGKRHLCCTLTLKPNGEIADLKIESPSGSSVSPHECPTAAADAKALALIRAAAPFPSFKSATNLSYSVDVPFLMVMPIDKPSPHTLRALY